MTVCWESGFNASKWFNINQKLYSPSNLRKAGVSKLQCTRFSFYPMPASYRSVIGLYFGTSVFMMDQANRYASAQIANMMV